MRACEDELFHYRQASYTFATIKCWWITREGPMEYYRRGIAKSTLQFNNTNSSLHVLPSDAATLNSCALRFHIHLRHGKGTTSYNYQVSFIWFCVSACNAAMFGFGGIPLMCLVAVSILAILRAKFI